MKGTITILSFVLAGCFSDGPEPVPPPPVPTQDQCPPGFGPIGMLGDGCYSMNPLSSWQAGEDLCETHQSMGIAAHLVVIDRDLEAAAFAQLARAGGDIWIGRMQTSPNAEFRNINYVVWEPEYFGNGEPNDYGEDCDLFDCDGRPGIGDERCIEFKAETTAWNDKACYRASRALCEWDGVAPLDWHPHPRSED